MLLSSLISALFVELFLFFTKLSFNSSFIPTIPEELAEEGRFKRIGFWEKVDSEESKEESRSSDESSREGVMREGVDKLTGEDFLIDCSLFF